MNIKNLYRPEYVYQPSLILRRLQRALLEQDQEQTVNLPWGLPIRIDTHETVGTLIWCYGLIDLVVAESIFRLVDRNECAIDVGANIGQMTSLMALRAGPTGHVIALEAHPQIYDELLTNSQAWSKHRQTACIETIHAAATDINGGTILLSEGENWINNKGTASIHNNTQQPNTNVHEVRATSIDELIGNNAIHYLKLDVEGHEESVLKGASKLLQSGRLRDIVFEEHDFHVSAVPRILQKAGYELFSLHSSILKPLLINATDRKPHKVQDGANYLATLDPDRAIHRFMHKGWNCLGRRSD